MESNKRSLLVTAALPYANGEIHLGHLVEYLQADFWVRFQKMRGHECLYFCADDTHGTPIMLSAKKQNTSPKELIESYRKKHLKDFIDFEIEFSHYGSTDSKENQILCESVFEKIQINQKLLKKPIKQLYSLKDKMFLPDRFVKGTCPRCKASNQYGDSCDACSATYDSTELIDPVSTISGDKPVEKESEHLFFDLASFQSFLLKWVSGHTSKEVSNKMNEWLKSTLKPWNISRDQPYFGFKIPGYEGKYFYVWLDAPIGYIAATKEWCDQKGLDFKDYWKIDSPVELYHFIGKDIIYFHALFWPALLKVSHFKTPNHLFVHGFLTINGEKMSKSKGTFIQARDYLNHLDPAYLRYYLACKMDSTMNDIDLNQNDFVDKVNSELIGKITNLISRSAQMLTRFFDGMLASLSDEGKKLCLEAKKKAEKMACFYEKRDFLKVQIEIRSIVEQTNRYFDQKKPWQLVSKEKQKTQQILTDTINLFRIAAICLQPILPTYGKNVASLFNEKAYKWSDLDNFLENKQINSYKSLMVRMDKKSVKIFFEEKLIY